MNSNRIEEIIAAKGIGASASEVYLLATEVRAARPVIEKATGMVHHWADCNCPTMNPQHPEEFDCMYNGQLEAALGHYEVGRTE